MFDEVGLFDEAFLRMPKIRISAGGQDGWDGRPSMCRRRLSATTIRQVLGILSLEGVSGGTEPDLGGLEKFPFAAPAPLAFSYGTEVFPSGVGCYDPKGSFLEIFYGILASPLCAHSWKGLLGGCGGLPG